MIFWRALERTCILHSTMQNVSKPLITENGRTLVVCERHELSTEDVHKLVEYLQHWLATGTLEKPQTGV